MFLSDVTIKEMLEHRHLIIHPFEPNRLRVASYVMSLGTKFIRFRKGDTIIDPFSQASINENLFSEETQHIIIVEPGEFLLAGTNEEFSLPVDIIGIVFNLSHLARIGLDVTLGSMMISAGFGLNKPVSLTLEIVNHNCCPVRLYSGMPICYLAFIKMDRATSKPYDTSIGIYSAQDSPVPSRYYVEYNRPTPNQASSEDN